MAAVLHMWLLLVVVVGVTACAAAAGGGSSATPSDGILQQLLQQPPWSLPRATNQQQPGVIDFPLDFTAADAVAREAEATQPLSLRGVPLAATSQAGFYHGNVAVVRFGGRWVMAARKLRFSVTPRSAVEGYPADPGRKIISWWESKISLCSADAASLQPTACSDFEPRNWTDCLWSLGFESLGAEDPRLFVWPGKGLFMLFVSKPWSVNPQGTAPADTACSGPWAQQPWLLPLATADGTAVGGGAAPAAAAAGSRDPWTSSGVIRLRYLPPDRAESQQQAGHTSSSDGHHKLHKQKNWNPFIYKDQLYFSQSFSPHHLVLKASPDGSCTRAFSSPSAAFRDLPAHPRGNTQAVLLPAGLSGLPADAYLGIVHVEVNRSYSNCFYTMKAHPPFHITGLSRELPLVPGTHPRMKQWTHISFPLSLQLLEDSLQLLIGYGSGDQQSRVQLMRLQNALALFGGSGDGGGAGTP